MTSKRLRPPSAPKYLLHKPSGNAFTYLYEDGKRRQVYLGEWNSPGSHREFRRIAALHLQGLPVTTSRQSRKPNHDPDAATVDELVARFLVWAEKHYRDRDGNPTGEISNYVYAAEPILKLHRDTPTDEFNIACLVQARGELISRKVIRNGEETTLSRNYINRQVGRMKFIFTKGVEFQLVSASVSMELDKLQGLGAWRSEARETDSVRPVPEADVKAVLPHVPPLIADMIWLNWLCGCRPHEITQIRTQDIDRSLDVWIYKPRTHKNGWRNPHSKKHERKIALCKEAQEILTPLLRVDGAPLFQPRIVDEWRRAEMRKNRRAHPTTNKARDLARKKNPKKTFNETYETRTYARLVRDACKAAQVDHWTPNQLRHACGTLIAKLYGREAASAQLGHADQRSTERYIDSDVSPAIEAMRQMELRRVRGGG